MLDITPDYGHYQCSLCRPRKLGLRHMSLNMVLFSSARPHWLWYNHWVTETGRRWGHPPAPEPWSRPPPHSSWPPLCQYWPEWVWECQGQVKITV